MSEDRGAAFLFDLDGTLVDSVYQHVLAWHEALQQEGIELSVWRIHRKIGMSGGLFTNMLLRETGLAIDPARIERLRHLHATAYKRRSADVRPLPGARELLAYLTDAGVPWAIATSATVRKRRCTATVNTRMSAAPVEVTENSPANARPSASGTGQRRRTQSDSAAATPSSASRTRGGCGIGRGCPWPVT